MRFMTIGLAVLLLGGLSLLDTSIEQSRPPRTTKDSAVVALAGQFRTVFANLLWIKLEDYHHEFISHNKDWTKNSDAVGLSRIITRLDPHFEEAYATGARMLQGLGKFEDARAYLEEGARNNPNSMLLHDEMGTLLAIHVKDYRGALWHFKRAYILAGDDAWQRGRLGRLISTVKRLAESEHQPAGS